MKECKLNKTAKGREMIYSQKTRSDSSSGELDGVTELRSLLGILKESLVILNLPCSAGL